MPVRTLRTNTRSSSKRTSITDENGPRGSGSSSSLVAQAPWLWRPSRKQKDERITDPLPSTVHAVVSNLVYVEKRKLPPSMLDRLIRIAAFQNPEFYRAQ